MVFGYDLESAMLLNLFTLELGITRYTDYVLNELHFVYNLNN